LRIVQNPRNEIPTSAESDADQPLGTKAMTDELNAGETTDQLDPEAGQQSQEAVNGTGEATVQEGEETEGQSTKTPAWVEKRFAEMTRSRHEAERRAEALQRDLNNALALARAGGTDTATTQAPATSAPVNEDERINQRASPEFFKSIVELDDAHKVLHALGSNPEEAARILALSPLKQGRELERLAAKPAPKKAVKPVSNAPEPISSHVDGSGSKAVDLDNSSIDDFMKARNSLPRRR
jgi:hypothetical protein